MKFGAIVAAALASVAVAAQAPQSFAGLDKVGDVLSLQGFKGIAKELKIGDIGKELNLTKLPKVSKASDLNATKIAPNKAFSSAAPSGHIVQNLGPKLDNILTIVGPDATTLLVQVSPEVTALISSLGLAGLGVPLGAVVASASGLGGLVTGLGPKVDGLVTVVGADVGALLISLSTPLGGLVSGLGLAGLGVPLGQVVATVGKNVKRGELLSDVSPEVKGTLVVTGENAKQLFVQLSPEVAELITGLGLGTAAAPLGRVVKTAGDLGDLVKDVSDPVDQLLHITNDDGKHLLIKLSPDVAAAVAGLGLAPVGTALGSLLTTVGKNL